MKILFLEDACISFESRTANTKKDFIHWVNHFLPDVIIAGRLLSKYSINDVLAYLKKHEILVAFVFVSDDKSNGLPRVNRKSGVDDFILRSEIHNLHIVVRNALKKKNAERKKMKTEAVKKTSDKKFHDLFDHQPECIFQIGSKGEFIEMNPVALEMTESSSEIKLGKSKLWEFIDKSDIKKLKSYHQRIFKGNKEDFTFRFVGNNGTSHLISTHAIPLVDSDDYVTSVLLLGKDISEKTEAEKRATQNAGKAVASRKKK